jgi:formate dehydrogenase subunit gamma
MRDRIVRHAGIDRLIHWVVAACVLVLLATAFGPILGFDFAWVEIHWWTGLILIAFVALHILRSLGAAVLRRSLRIDAGALPRGGKYSLAQKAIHLAFAVVVLTACVTGALMMVKVDTPWWERDPYWLADETWGLIYVLHGFAALFLITMVMAHVYFALRPEKFRFLRAMVLGWITREEFEKEHDPDRWEVSE